MKKLKLSAILYYVAAILFYISAVINFAGENSNYMAGLWICIGSTFLCLGISHSKKSKENKEKKINKSPIFQSVLYCIFSNFRMMNNQGDRTLC